MSKHNLTILLAALTVATASATAQTLADGQVRITHNSVTLEEGRVNVSLTFNLDALHLASNDGIAITPLIAKAADTLRLPSVEILGRQRYIYYQRNGSTATADPMLVTRRTNNTPQTVDYAYLLPYEQWMDGADLVMQQDECGCNNVIVGGPILADAGQLYLDDSWAPQLAYMRPPTEPVKHRTESGSARLVFPINKHNIVPTMGNNQQELDEIRRTISSVADDADLSIKSIALHGYASPDGSYAFNERLAQNRTEAIANHLKQQYNLNGVNVESRSTAEDWEGMREAVVSSDMPDKQAVIGIIDSGAAPDAKEQDIRSNHAAAHRYLADNIYPGLRRTDYTIYYDIRNFDLDEARDIINKSPQKLSLEEMYSVANSYPVGSEEYSRAYETAVTMYPDDEVANINAANVALMRGHYDRAERFLAKAGNSAQAENARGALALHNKDYAEARAHFNAAAQAGLAEANANLSEMNKRKL